MLSSHLDFPTFISFSSLSPVPVLLKTYLPAFFLLQTEEPSFTGCLGFVFCWVGFFVVLVVCSFFNLLNASGLPKFMAMLVVLIPILVLVCVLIEES